VDAGEIGAGHTATAIYKVKLAPGAEGRIATVQLRWQDAEAREVHEINGNFNTWDMYPSYEESDPYYQLAVLVAAYAEVLRASPYADATLEDIAQMAAAPPAYCPNTTRPRSSLTWPRRRLDRREVRQLPILP